MRRHLFARVAVGAVAFGFLTCRSATRSNPAPARAENVIETCAARFQRRDAAHQRFVLRGFEPLILSYAADEPSLEVWLAQPCAGADDAELELFAELMRHFPGKPPIGRELAGSEA